MFRRYLGIGLLVVVICFGFILINGCAQMTPTSTTTTTVPTGGVEYFPNTDGYQWNYTYLVSGTSGTMLRKFNGTQTVGGNVFQKFLFSQDFAATGEVLAKVLTSEVKYYGTPSSPTTEATLWLNFPLQVGKNWTMQPASSATATVEAYQSITVPAGTYNAFRILHDLGTATTRYHYWYAENIGIVAFEISWGTRNITAELTSRNF